MSVGGLGERGEDRLKSTIFSQRGEQGFDRDRPASEWRVRLLDETLQRVDRVAGTARENVMEGLGHRRFARSPPVSQGVDRAGGPLERGVGGALIAVRGVCSAKSK